MAHNYAEQLNTKVTPQDRPIPGREKDMAKNNAGGYTFTIDKWEKLKRFLILGSEGGTYYVREQELTKRNIDSSLACIKDDPIRVLNTIIEISDSGRAPKNDQAIFLLALLITNAPSKYKKEISKALPKICRIGTHLFTFVHYLDQMRSWGRSVRRAVSNWYAMDTDRLAYQLIKYKGRSVEGSNNQWTHRDVLRSAHVKPKTIMHNRLFGYATKEIWEYMNGISIIDAVEELKKIDTSDIKASANIIANNNVPHEAWPTELKNYPEIWESALANMPLMATIRNLGKLSNLEVLAEGKFDAINLVAEKITNADYIKKSRVHPLAILTGLRTYGSGHGVRGSLTWNPVQKIVDALDEAFYLSFNNVEPTGGKTLLALDVSGSMTAPLASGILSCREASAALALITANVEKDCTIVGFTSKENLNGFWGNIDNTILTPLNISPKMRLGDVIQNISRLPFGGTDCALPMMWAEKKGLNFDNFAIYTDSETWAGNIQPIQALKKYRNAINPEARLCVVGMVSSGFSIADPNDRGSLDVVGFDTATPNIMSAFFRGEI